MRNKKSLIVFGVIAFLCLLLVGCYEDPTVVLVQKPEINVTSFVYDGSEKSVKINYVPELVEISGTRKATDSGKYFITASLKDKEGIRWEDGSCNDIIFVWSIDKAKIQLPVIESERKYQGIELFSGA
ncbi:MAG: hypothetical protein ACI4SL_02605, partial [Candidatus Ornithospirochaeta sp.]